MSLSYCPTLLPRHKSPNTKWSGWPELNLRGHVPKTCGWPLPYTRILVARHGVEPCPLAFQTSTLPYEPTAAVVRVNQYRLSDYYRFLVLAENAPHGIRNFSHS